jgi:hypothetical protein
MNYLQLVQRLKVESGRSGAVPDTLSGLTVNDQRLANWVADQWLEIQRRRRDWNWMRKTVTGPLQDGVGVYGSQDIDGGADPQSRWCVQTDDYTITITPAAGGPPRELTMLNYEQFQRLYLIAPPAASVPLYWSQSLAGKLLLGPVPEVGADWVIAADFFKRPTLLVGEDDEPDMPEEFHILIMWRALLELAGMDAAPEVEARARRNVQTLWADLVATQTPKLTLSTKPLL